MKIEFGTIFRVDIKGFDMQAKCPSCNFIFEVPEEYKGENTKCPKCKQVFVLDSKNENNSIPPKTKWKILVIFVFLGVLALIWLISHHHGIRNSQRKTAYLPYSKNGSSISTNEGLSSTSSSLQINENPEEYIFTSVVAFDYEERGIVLRSALSKMKSVLRCKNEDILCSWLTLYTTPMTATEVEILGDYLFEQLSGTLGYEPDGLKMLIYWNVNVAEVCQKAGYNAESQSYNSFWESGKRASGAKPKSLSEGSLHESLCSDWPYLLSKHKKYDHDQQILYVETSVGCMTELIFNTFNALYDGLRCCVFDRLPNLKAVRITYKDIEGNVIGGATLDFQYWAEMIQIRSVPTEVYDRFFEEWQELSLRYKSKLITEEEFETKSRENEEIESNLKAYYYQEKWLKLFPLLKDFTLDKELPLITEDFKL